MRRSQLLMPVFGPPAQVRPYFGYRNAVRVRLTARALRMREPDWNRGGTVRKLAAMLGQFASSEVPALEVTLEIARADGAVQRFTQVSDADGYLHFDVEAGAGTPSDDPIWERARLTWINRDGPQSVSAFLLSPGEADRLAVVSDIDDTVVETGAGDLLRNWRRVLAQMPGDRTAVPGAAAFYTRIGARDAAAAGRRPFFYVSSSPWNLFDYLVAFQKLHKLPQGPLLLRDWDLSRQTLGWGSHGGHKLGAIEDLLEFYPNMRFALIGDNTQADAIAYGEVVTKHPGRVAGVFIRQAPGADMSAEEQAALSAIRAAKVPLWTGDSYAIGEDFLASVGFTKGGETAQIVHTIEGQPAPAPAPVPGPVDLAKPPA